MIYFKNTLHELDHQQYVVLHQARIDKENLEREKQKLKLLFKQKRLEASELEKKIYSKIIVLILLYTSCFQLKSCFNF